MNIKRPREFSPKYLMGKHCFFLAKKPRFLMKPQLYARNKLWQKLHPDFIMYLNWMFLPYRKYMGKKSAKWVAVQCILIRHRLDRILLEAACERQGTYPETANKIV